MRQVLVVGGSGGLGTAVVKELVRRGLGVVVAGRARPSCAQVSTRGRAPDRSAPTGAPAVVVDATKADWRAVYRDLEAQAGAFEGVVFVAGRAVYGRTALVPLERAREVFELNFWACTAAATAAAEHWTERGRAGTFLAVLSIVARRAVPFEAHYAASKAAAARMLECLQLEYASRRIRFVCAYPGTLETPFRSRAEWYGIERTTSGGTSAAKAARALVELLEGRRKTRVIGWRERSIDLADRITPGLYDRVVLRRRAKRVR